MGFFDIFSNNMETSELHTIKDLRTRYYKTNFKKIKEQVEKFTETHGILIKHVDDIHGEMFLQTTKYHIILTIVQINPLETAVDMKVQTYKLAGLNEPKNRIIEMYKYLDSVLPFKGTSLHP